MTKRVVLLVEVNLDANHQPKDAREHVANILANCVPSYRPTVELTAHAPANTAECWELLTLNSRYDLTLNADGSGQIVRKGGSSPYVPPEIACRPYDGEVIGFDNGRFEADAYGEVFAWGRNCHTSPIKTRTLATT
jgi:hypothetical protein